MLTGEHAEWLLGTGVPLDEVLALMAAADDLRAPDTVVSVDCPPTEQDRTTWPAPYTRAA